MFWRTVFSSLELSDAEFSRTEFPYWIFAALLTLGMLSVLPGCSSRLQEPGAAESIGGAAGSGVASDPAQALGQGGSAAGGASSAPTSAVSNEPPAGPQVVNNPALCDPSTLQIGPAPLRRLSRIEYNNAMRDLLGDTTHPAATFVAEEKVLGFSSNSLTPVTEVINEQYLDAALQIAERALPNLAQRWPCVAQGGGEACARTVLHDLARQAYRGALDSTEEDRLVALYRSTATALDDSAGLQAGIAAVLTSPRFLYVLELGAAGATDAVVPLSQYEVAARLAFFLWRSLPDEMALAAADRGELATPEQVEAQARRMFDDARANDALDDFVTQWMQIENMSALSKSSTVYPEFSDQLKQSMLQETLSFYRETVRGTPGDVATLLTASHSYINRQLAQYYGVGSNAPDDTSFVLTELNSDPNNLHRAGLLTQGSVLAMHAHPTRASPVHRGKLVREQLLCQPLPPPPPNVKNTLPEDNMGSATRDVFSQHATDPACAGCHRLMDPIGFGFGHYDGMGKYLDNEGGLVIDAKGEVLGAGASLDGPFEGAVELANKLTTSGLVEPCFAVQLTRYAFGRAETMSDACSLQDTYAKFVASGFQVRDLMAAIARSDSFRMRRRVDAGM
ncbi:MAG TPA: DUF1592 domain-containing protein, partial [Polyangiaceae bacterium]|nr:DUF1592 domain-containing protein [Polyangiaceae bacterium]